jgi:hypothetical protein
MNPEDALESSMGKEELETKIKAKIEELSGLVDREKAIGLIAEEMGLTGAGFVGINELRDGMKGFGLKATVDYVSETVKTPKTSFRDVGIFNEQGKAVLRLWRTQYEKYRLVHGDEILLRGCNFAFGAVQLGYDGSLTVLKKAGFMALDAVEKEGIYNLRGKLQRKDEGYVLAGEGRELPTDMESETFEGDALLERFSWDGKVLRRTAHSRVFKKVPSVRDNAAEAP